MSRAQASTEAVTGSGYLRSVARLVGAVADDQHEQIGAVGARIADSIEEGGVLHLFGAGHSRLPAEDVFIRAGSLSATRAIWPDRISDTFERHEGLGSAVLSQGDVRAGEVLVVISHSGINPMPIDVAAQAREQGAYVVGLGSRRHSLAVESRHSTGKRLVDVVDVFLDTLVPVGDALVSSEQLPAPVGPASTVIGSCLLHALLVEATGRLVARGCTPPVRVSRNLPAGDEINARLAAQYAERIPELRWV